MVKRSLVVAMILVFIATNVFSQMCGTEVDSSFINYLDSTYKIRKSIINHKQSKSIPSNAVIFLIKNIVVRRSDGTGGTTVNKIDQFITSLNRDFNQADIYFISCEDISYINNDTFYDYSQSQESQVPYIDDNNAINIYYFNSILNSNGLSLGGYTKFPSGNPNKRLWIRGGSPISTMLHEMGHFFSLYHTHGKNNCGTTDELVNGSNCQTAGDELCDTPADPNLLQNCATRLVDNNCNYTGNINDSNGDLYSPSTINIMSYSRSHCITEFTAGQQLRMFVSAVLDHQGIHVYNYNLSIPTGYLISANNTVFSLPNFSLFPNFMAIEIVASNQIYNNSNVNYIASESIKLTSGFHVDNSSEFVARIGFDCDIYNGGIQPFSNAAVSNDESNNSKQLIAKNNNTDNVIFFSASIYPNPTHGNFTIQSAQNIDEVKVVDIYGKEIVRTTQLSNTQLINLSQEAKGIYFVHIRSGEQVVIEKVIRY